MKMKITERIDPRVLKALAKKIAHSCSPEEIGTILKKSPKNKDPEMLVLSALAEAEFLDNDVGESANDYTLRSLIEKFLDPLNLGGDWERADHLANEIDAILSKYTDYAIPYGFEGGIVDRRELIPTEEEEKLRELEESKEVETIRSKLEDIEEIDQLFKQYQMVLYTFCKHPNPTTELNSTYVTLRKALSSRVSTLGLRHHLLELYVPFYDDLYTAQEEWARIAEREVKIDSGRVEWGKMRSKLLSMKGQIEKLKEVARGPVLSENLSTLLVESEKSIKKHIDKFVDSTTPVQDQLAISGKHNDFLLELQTGLIRLNKCTNKVTPNTKLFKVLKLLATQHGKAVSYR